MLNIKSKMLPPKRWLKRKKRENNTLSVQSSLSSFAQNYLHKCKDTYFILQKKYIHIYEDSFRAKMLRDDCTLTARPLVLASFMTLPDVLVELF